MTPQSADFFAGVPVQVDPEKIERELTKLWKPPEVEGDHPSAVTRACLSNLIAYLPGERASEYLRELLPGVGRRFPSRFLLLSHNGARAGELSASISAVCHLTSPGTPAVCCEQILLEAHPEAQRSSASGDPFGVFPGAVAPLLVPDVPVTLLVLSAGGERLLELLEPVVDRVVFDSRELPAAALGRPLAALQKGRVSGIDDLAWRETLPWRRTLREIFDDPRVRPLLFSLREIQVAYSGVPACALLLAGWLASRVGRPALPIHLDPTDRRQPAGRPGTLGAIHLEAGGSPGVEHLTVTLSDDAKRLRVAHATRGACVIPRSVPFLAQDEARLLGGAIERTTDQGVLRGALEVACRTLSCNAEKSDG